MKGLDPRVTVSVIMAISRNGVIGDCGKLPWNLPADMKHFRFITMGGIVIMGRKTYESIPITFRPLPGRLNIILTRDTQYWSIGLVRNSLPSALKLAMEPRPSSGLETPPDVFIIGGAEVFKEALTLPEVTHLYITRIDADFEGDVRLDLDLSGWELVSSDPHARDSENHFDYCFEVYKRKAPVASFVNLDNARLDEQREVMRKIIASGECPFCQENLLMYHKQPILRESGAWLLTHNQWPYKHLRVHLLLIAKEHAESLKDLPIEAGLEMLEMCQWAEKKFDIKSGALAIRFGDVRYNGATVRHLHVHIVAGNHEHPDFETVRFKVASRPKS